MSTKRICLWFLVSAAALQAAEPLRLEQALRMAVGKAQADRARVEVAEGQLKLLEAQSKWKFELRPTLGLFSFSNPALLAASLGSGLAMQRWSAPSPLAMRNARFDVLAAEVASERLRIETEIRTARAFYELLERQQVAAMVAQSIGQRRESGQQVTRMVNAGRATAIEELSVESQLLDLEQQLVDADDQRRLSAIQLASLLGDPGQADSLRVADIVGLRVEAEVPAIENLLNEALRVRPELRLLRKRLTELERESRPQRPVRLDSAGAGYAFVTDAPGILGSGLKGGLLGGNTGRGEVTLAIPLRKTGEKEAGDAVLAARARLLEVELRNMEQELRTELSTARSYAVAAKSRMRIAAKRVELADRQASMITARAEAGLASQQEAMQAEQLALRARAELAQAQGQQSATIFALRAVCGLEDNATQATMAWSAR